MKILVFTKNWLGDILFQLPALGVLRRDFPDAEIVCACPKRCEEILKLQPQVNRVLVFDEKREHRSLLKRFAFVRDLRKERFDRVYLFHRSKTRVLLSLLAGIPERIGYAHDRRGLLTKAIRDPQGPLHHLDYFLHLLKSCGHKLRPEDGIYHFQFSEKDRTLADDKLAVFGPAPFVCFHLGANWEPKRWPVKHFAELADKLSVKWGLKTVITGSKEDEELGAEFFKHLKQAKPVSFLAKTGLGELGRIFQRSLFVVSGDSGPMHIAAGVGTPVAALFGPTNPDLTGPRGPGKKIVLTYVPPGFTTPWYGPDLPEGGWLSHITTDTVLSAIEQEKWITPLIPSRA